MSYALLTGSDPAPDSVIELIVATPGRPFWLSFMARFAYSASPADRLAVPAPPCWAACCAISWAFLMLSINPIQPSPLPRTRFAATLSEPLWDTLLIREVGGEARKRTGRRDPWMQPS